MTPFISAASAAVLALCASAAVAGDPVYKSTMPDGRVVYGESAMPGAKRVDKVAAPPTNAGVIVATPEEKSRAASLRTETGGVTVIPQAPKYPARPAQQGYVANPTGALSGGY